MSHQVKFWQKLLAFYQHHIIMFILEYLASISNSMERKQKSGKTPEMQARLKFYGMEEEELYNGNLDHTEDMRIPCRQKGRQGRLRGVFEGVVYEHPKGGQKRVRAFRVYEPVRPQLHKKMRAEAVPNEEPPKTVYPDFGAVHQVGRKVETA